MEHPFQPFLDAHDVVILDGAMATELERRGADLNDPLWSAKILLESPERIRDVHYDYFMAGADIAITASYQASVEGFARRGLSESKAISLIQLSVELARQARDDFWCVDAAREGRLRPLIAGSIGCYGAFLADGSEYRGNYGLSLEELKNYHRPRMEALLTAGVDLLACETLPCELEARALVELLHESGSVPAWLSFSCRDESTLCDGSPLAQCGKIAHEAENVVAVGINCTHPRFVADLLRKLSEETDLPLVAYPNSGETWDANQRRWGEDPDIASFAEPAREWHRLGARLIGGCCRTTPDTVRELAAVLQAHSH